MKKLVHTVLAWRYRLRHGRFRATISNLPQVAFPGEKYVISGCVRNDNKRRATVYVVVKIAYAHPASHDGVVFNSDVDSEAPDRFALRLHQIVPGENRYFPASVQLPLDARPGIYDCRVELWTPAKLDVIDNYRHFPHLHLATPWQAVFNVVPHGGPADRPTVFISYAWISADHEEWVQKFADRLKQFGIEYLLDRHDLQPGDDLDQFMDRLSTVDFVIPVCSETYTERSNAGGVTGVAQETRRARILFEQTPEKFLPILRDNPSGSVPTYLQKLWHVSFDRNDWSGEPLFKIVIKIRQAYTSRSSSHGASARPTP